MVHVPVTVSVTSTVAVTVVGGDGVVSETVVATGQDVEVSEWVSTV